VSDRTAILLSRCPLECITSQFPLSTHIECGEGKDGGLVVHGAELLSRYTPAFPRPVADGMQHRRHPTVVRRPALAAAVQRVHQLKEGTGGDEGGHDFVCSTKSLGCAKRVHQL
jgi:hypothetical protein